MLRCLPTGLPGPGENGPGLKSTEDGDAGRGGENWRFSSEGDMGEA